MEKTTEITDSRRLTNSILKGLLDKKGNSNLLHLYDGVNSVMFTQSDTENKKDNNFPSSHYFRQKEKKYGNLLVGFDLGNGPLLVFGPDWKFFVCLTSVIFISFFFK